MLSVLITIPFNRGLDLEGDDRIYYSENPAIASPFYKNQNPLPLTRPLTVPVLTIIGATKGNWGAV